MKVENGLIKECTIDELFHYFCSRGFDDIMTFYDFKYEFIQKGVKIIYNESN